MRFYKFGRTLREVLTCIWMLLLLGVVAELAMRHGKASWHIAVSALLALVQLSSMWADYWTVEADGIVQHGLFYRKFFAARGLRYAGPVRRERFNRWLRRSIEVETADGGYPRYVGVADRSAFLEALRRIAPPHAEIIG